MVEAVQLLTAFTSFRNASPVELVRNGCSSARAHIEVTDGNRRLEIALAIDPGGQGERGKKTYLLNGKKRSAKDLRGTLPSIAFTPDDLGLVKGSDKGRRRELDVLGAQLNVNYYQLVRDYEKVLRHKNRLLKDEAPVDLIEATNVLFAKVGAQLTTYRSRLFDRLLPYMAAHYADISSAGETFEACYLPSTDSSLAEALDDVLPDERTRHRSLVGPHLDKIELYVDGLDASAYASQGQQRSVVLALKLAEAALVEEMCDQLPILLLDDVMSELDAARREALVQELLPGKQTIITTANIDYFDAQMLNRATLIELSK